MHWLISAYLAPIPLFHFWMHALLSWWKKHPLLFYICGLSVWALSLLLFWKIDKNAALLFAPSEIATWIGYGLIATGIIMFAFSIGTIGPKRFFMMAVIKPESVKQERLASGPFCFFPHPAYLGYLVTAFGNFLASGKIYALGILIFGMTLLPLVIWLEEEELKKRTDAKKL